MKLIAAILVLFVLATLLPMAGAAQVNDSCMIRGQVTNVGVNQFTWDNTSFAGFYYDMNKNLGAETLTFRPTLATPTGATLSDQPNADGYRGVTYETKAQIKKFKYKPWGQYDVIGFLGDIYFAAYDPTVTADVSNAGADFAYLYDASRNRNLMTNEQISKLLVDDNMEMIINSTNPLKLADGYQLAIKSINSNETKVILELDKDGHPVDTKIIQPSIAGSKMSDQTYYYKAHLGYTADIIQIAVHFKNVFHNANKDSATVNGEFQISDTPVHFYSDQQYDKMSIRNVDATGMTITMDNKDNQITLSKNKDVALMQNIHINTADQDGTADSPLRYCIYSV